MTIFEMSAGGAVLIAVILLLRRALLYRLPKWTFLLLWAVALCRLLIPLSVPSQLSVYTGVARVVQSLEKEEAPSELPPANGTGTLRVDGWTVPAVPVPTPAPEQKTVSPVTALYLTGASLCGLFFLAAYGWGLRRFHNSEPAEQDFTRRWQEEHPTPFPVRIKTCAAVKAPLAYGLLWPVVLLPKNTDWSDEDQLTYVLTHEYVHIRRGDLLWKLLLTAALCVHWFNPLVWAMYLRANRDLELACDEAVVRILGLDSRKSYACALLSAAESGFFPLCTTYTTKNHMEERIRAIMKIKQKSLAALLTAALLVAGVTAVFATSPAPEPKNINDLPQASQSDPLPSSAPEQKPVLSEQPEENKTENPAGTISAEPWEGEVVPVQNETVSGTVDTPASQPQEPSGDEPASDDLWDPLEAWGPIECWGLPDGPLAEGTVLHARSEAEFREMIQQIRLKGYSGFFSLVGQPADDWYIAILDRDFDGVQRDLTPPTGITADWTYPVNSKGETYGNFLGFDALGYYPDLVAAKASNGREGYMSFEESSRSTWRGEELDGDYFAYMKAQPKVREIPVYDVNHDTILGYFEQDNPYSSDFVTPPELIEDVLNTIEEHMREIGCSEEEITLELERYKAERGWD